MQTCLGFEKVSITPCLPVRLAGFGGSRWAHSVHDDLYARIFLFKAQEEILWVQLDLVAVDDVLIHLIAEKTKIKNKNIILSATHTHSGPFGCLSNEETAVQGLESIFGDLNANYLNEVAQKISEATMLLKEKAEPFEYRILQGKVHGLGTDRHDASLACDEDALLLEFKLQSGKRCLLTRMACHPTVLNAENTEITADFPYAIEKFMEQFELVAFVNGSCGDMSTRFTRQNNGFTEAERFGKVVVNQLNDLLNQDIPYRNDFSIQVNQRNFEVQAKIVDSVEVAEAKLAQAKVNLEDGKKKNLTAKEIRILESYKEGASNNLLATRNKGDYETFSLSVSWIQLPKFNLITVPVELFSKLSNPLKELLNAEFIGYSNGYFLYMADENAFDQGFYESYSSPFQKGAAEKLMQEIADWVKARNE